MILFGEHAVVYGFTGVATAISKRTRMKAELFKTTRTEINIIDNLKTTSFNPYLHPDTPLDKREQMFYYAFRHFPKNHSLNIEITNEFPIGHGLGSSASFCSLIAAASLRAEGKEATRNSIFPLSVKLESFFHNNPSGLDPATVVYGGCVIMNNRQIVTPSIKIPNIPLLIVDTNTSKSTLKAVNQVKFLSESNPTVYKPMLRILGELSTLFCNSDNKEKTIETYFPVAQNILSSLQLSTKEIDDIVSIAKNNGLVAKISGSGMGGIVLISGKSLQDKISQFSKYDVIHAEIGSEGICEE